MIFVISEASRFKEWSNVLNFVWSELRKSSASHRGLRQTESCSPLFFLQRLKLHQVLRNEHLTGKVFLYFFGPWHVIVSTEPLRQVR